MPERAVVIFLFAQEKLLFRYPIENPFIIDVHNRSAGSNATNRNASVVGGRVNTKRSTETASVSTPGATTSTTGVVAKGKEKTETTVGKQQQQQPATTGVGVRHKPRVTVQSRKQHSQSAAAESKNPNGMSTLREIPHPRSAASPVRPNPNGGRVDTCVGIQPTALLHLLHASFVACTTIQFAGGTFIVYPLLPSSTASKSRPTRGTAASLNPLDDVSQSSGDSNDNSSSNSSDNGSRKGEDENGEELNESRTKEKTSRRAGRRSQGVLLVVAMNRPDFEDGAIANFVQSFMNVIVREELRSCYVTQQVAAIESRVLSVISSVTTTAATGTGTATATTTTTTITTSIKTNSHINAPTSTGNSSMISGPRSLTADMHTRLLQDPQLTLCAELAQLAKHIAAVTGEWSNNNDKNDGDAQNITIMQSATNLGPMNNASTNNSSGTINNNNNNNNNASTTSGNYSRDVSNALSLRRNGGPHATGVTQTGQRVTVPPPMVRGLFALRPLRCGRTTGEVSATAGGPLCLRQNPNYLIALDEPDFAERLTRPYAETVGRRAAQLLPLSAIRTAFVRLTRPWRVGALYRTLERIIADSQQQQHQQQQQQQQQQQRLGVSRQALSAWQRQEESDEMGNAEESAGAAAAAAAADGEALAVEAVEFLRREGVIAVDTEVTVLFTHGDLAKPRHVQREMSHRGRGRGRKKGKRVNPKKNNSTNREGEFQGPCVSSPEILNSSRSSSSSVSRFSSSLSSASSTACVACRAPPSLAAVFLMEGLRSRQAGITSFPTTPSPAGEDGAEMGMPLRLEVCCAWGEACPLCEELAAAPYLWRLGGIQVSLVFPFLDASVTEAAARRALLAPQRGVDPECCNLLADQRPWFTHPETFMAPAAPVDRTPLQLYRRLTQGKGNNGGGGENKMESSERNSTRGPMTVTMMTTDTCTNTSPTLSVSIPSQQTSSIGASSVGVDKNTKALAANAMLCAAGEGIVALTPDGISPEARVWLAANCEAIEERLQKARRRRRALEERAARGPPREPKPIQQRPKEPRNEEVEQNKEQESGSPVAGQRYRKRAPFSPASAPTTGLLSLPPNPFALGDDSLLAGRLIGTERTVPMEALMQFVLHHAVVLLWGKTGMNVETLLQLLERNLRRLRFFLANFAYMQQLRAHSSEASTAGKSPESGSHATIPGYMHTEASVSGTLNPRSSQSNIFDHSKNDKGGISLHMWRKADDNGDTSALEHQLRLAYEVFEELSLIDALWRLSGLTVEVVPTRLLLHAVVNAFSDVLLIGGGGPVSMGLQVF